jgi:outer membrane protein
MRKSFTVLFMLAGSTWCHADVIGTHFGVGVWAQDPSGTGNYQGTEFDVDDDLRLDSDTGFYAWLAVEHPLPLLPNFRVRYTPIKTEGSGEVDAVFTFGGTTYNVGTDIETKLELSEIDGTFYYEVLDNWVNLDLGLNIKYVTGEIFVDSDSAPAETAEFKAPVPMLYGNAQFDLPFTGFSLGAELNYIGYSGNNFMDYLLQIGYESDYHLGGHLGFRGQNLKIDDIDDVSADIDVKGVFGDVFVHF